MPKCLEEVKYTKQYTRITGDRKFNKSQRSHVQMDHIKCMKQKCKEKNDYIVIIEGKKMTDKPDHGCFQEKYLLIISSEFKTKQRSASIRLDFLEPVDPRETSFPSSITPPALLGCTSTFSWGANTATKKAGCIKKRIKQNLR